MIIQVVGGYLKGNMIIHKHIIKVDNTKTNRILIRWLTDICIKYSISFKVHITKNKNQFFVYKGNQIFPILRNINKIQKRLIETNQL
jgi:hypothetical protein